MDEKDQTIKELRDTQEKAVREYSDNLKLMRQQYAINYEERTALQRSVKEKDEEIINLREKLVKYDENIYISTTDVSAWLKLHYSV